jgi:hypothetical protein
VAKPGPECRICGHERRDLLELGLINKVPVRVLSKRFGVPKSSLHRHRQLHLSPALVAALVAGQKGLDPVELARLHKVESESLLASLAKTRARLELLSSAAFEEGAIGAATHVENVILRTLEFGARLVGQLAVRHEVAHTHFLLSPSYLQVRQTLMQVLRKHPAVAAEVARELGKLELEAADELKAQPRLIEASAC